MKTDLIGEGTEGLEKLSKVSHQLIHRGGGSSFDSICASIVQLPGRASAGDCRSRKYLGDPRWSPSLSRHDSKGLAKPVDSLPPHTANRSGAWNPSPPLLTVEGL